MALEWKDADHMPRSYNLGRGVVSRRGRWHEMRRAGGTVFRREQQQQASR